MSTLALALTVFGSVVLFSCAFALAAGFYRARHPHRQRIVRHYDVNRRRLGE